MNFANATEPNRNPGERSGGICGTAHPLTKLHKKHHPKISHSDRHPLYLRISK